jgi:hypothetical protein
MFSGWSLNGQEASLGYKCWITSPAHEGMILYEQIDVESGETSIATNKVQKIEGEEKREGRG